MVVDDGSSDDSGRVLDELALRKDPRIVIVRKRNGGQASAINAGLNLIGDGVVGMLDGDDLWLPSKAATVMEAFAKCPEAVMVQHPLIRFVPSGREMFPPRRMRRFSGDLRPLMGATGGANVFEPTSGLSFRVEALKKWVPLPEEWRICADGPLVYGAAATGPVVSLDEPLGRYRIHGRNKYVEAPIDYDMYEQRVLAIHQFYNGLVGDAERYRVRLADQLHFQQARYYQGSQGFGFLRIASMIMKSPLHEWTQRARLLLRFAAREQC